MPSLREFQKTGVVKLLPERSSLNGDDMGLGKTVQAIALDVGRRRKHNCDYTAQTLVVTVMSVMDSWKDHFEEWAPHLKVYVINPKNRAQFLRAMRAKNSDGHPQYHVFVCHWQVLRHVADDLKKVGWFHVIGDEVQAIKNRKAQVTRAFKAMKPYYRTGLSGTWADNNPDDAWSILNWLWPDKFPYFTSFSNEHTIKKTHNEGYCMAEGCTKTHTRTYREIVGTYNAEKIHKLIASGYIRRRKEEVLDDLPEKFYSTIKVDLGAKQRVAYNSMRDTMLAWVGKHQDEPVAAPIVIAKLIRLQQFACAYGQLETITKRGELLSVLRLTDPSSKLDAVMDLVGETNESVVVFSQSKQVVNLLGERLTSAGISHGLLTGDTSVVDRNQLVQDFQSGRHRVFASTIKAGGVGLTLTAASTCVFIDRAWSPSANRQAEDRLHRMGQKNSVHIIDLVARETIDAGRNQKILWKWEWLRQILGDKEPEVRKEIPYFEKVARVS